MKDFFQRHEAKIEVNDLQRFARVLIDDISPTLSGYEFVIRLFDSPQLEAELTKEIKEAVARNQVYCESDSGRLHLPIVRQGVPLGLITAAPSTSATLSETAFPILPALVRLSLEKILLYKINVTDHETGLNNEDYFRAYLRQRLKKMSGRSWGGGQPKHLRLGDKEEQPGLTVMLVEIAEFDKLAANHGRLEAGRMVKTLAERLKDTAPSSSCLARLDRSRLGLVLPDQDIQAGRELASNLVLPPGQLEKKDAPRMRVAVGLANYPFDFTDEPGQGKSPETEGGALAELLSDKAELALRQALTDKGTPVFTFRDVLRRGGRVVQVLPYNRVVVNVGRIAGARGGQIFVLSDAEKAAEADYKAEVVLFDVQEDFAVGEVINLRHSTGRIQPGDVLALSRLAGEEPLGGDMTGGESLDPLLGVPDHNAFIRLLSEKTEAEDRFAVILTRVDGFDRYRTTMGHLESDRQFKALFELLQEDIPEKALVGRFSADSLAVFWPGSDEAGAKTLAETWRDKIVGRHPRTCSFGLAVFPHGPFSKSEIVTNAQKALEVTGFFGPASVAVFDSVSLNISGDKLFEAGDLDGAVREFTRALELNPADLNVLNSLAVCYGHQQNWDLALETFGRVLKLDPDNLMAHFNQGFVLAGVDRYQEALESLRRAAEIENDNFDVLFQLGKTALELDLVDEALSAFEQAAGLEDHRPIVFRYLGQTLLKAGRPEDGVDAFQAAARHDPEDAPSLSQLGVLFLDRGTDSEVALSLTRQSVNLDRTNSLFRQRLARALTVVGDLEESEAEYRRAIEMGVRSREVFYELGQVILKQDRPEEAEKLFRESLAVDQEYGPALEALGKETSGQDATRM